MQTTSGPSPMVSVETRRPGQRDVVDAQQRRAAVGQAEQALEADGQVEVAAGVEQALPEGLDARQLALAQGQPGLGVGADDDVGLAPRAALAHARPVGRAAHLPGLADVAQAHVVGRVEVLRRAEIALGQRAEGLVDQGEAPGVGQLAGHGRAPYTRPRPIPAPAIRRVRTLRRLGVDGPRDPPPRHAHRPQAAAGAARPGARRHLLVRADGLQPHPHRQRAALRRPLAAQALPRARGLRGDARGQRHRHQRQDLRRRAAAGRRRAPTWRAR